MTRGAERTEPKAAPKQRAEGAVLLCEHCGQEHQGAVSFCPITGKITHPERFFPAGTVVGEKYRVGAVLGAGGMGAVFEATHTMLQKRVAVKLMLPEMARDRELMSRMVREARTAGATGHRNVVAVTDMGWTEQGALFLVMEYLEGRTLRRLLKEEGPQPLERAANLVFQILSALIAVHDKGIVHRDLKPDNVMLTEGDEGEELVKVLDFGISKVLKSEQRLELTRTGSVLGSPRYMSPEQARGGNIDRRTDIYSVGAILYQLLAGRPPLRAKNFTAMIAAILSETIPPPSTYAPGLPSVVDHIVLKALARDADERFGDARAFRQALRPFARANSAGGLVQRGLEIEVSTRAGPAPSGPVEEVGEIAALSAVVSPSVRESSGKTSLDSGETSLGSGDLIAATSTRVSPEEGPACMAAEVRAPEALSGSGLIEPATIPGSSRSSSGAPMASADSGDEAATVRHGALAASAETQPVEATAREEELSTARVDLGPQGSALAVDVVDPDDPRQLADGLEPLAATVGGAAKPSPGQGQELELDLDDAWRRDRGAHPEAGRLGDGEGEPDQRPPAVARASRQGRHRLRRLLTVLLPLVIAGVLALAGYAHRDTIAGWFGGSASRGASAEMLLLIVTSPHDAEVRLDGVLRARRSLSIPRDHETHRVRVSAPGYHPKTVKFRADVSRRLSVHLERER